MSKMNPLVSVIVVNWNGRRFLEDCLDSLAHQTYGNLEVVLVDNGSKDGSIDFVKERYPWVKTISNASNMGQTRANLEGARTCKGELVVLANNDIKVDDDAIQKMVMSLMWTPQAGAVGPRVIGFSDFKPQYHPTRYVPSLAKPWSSMRIREADTRSTCATDVIGTCFLMIKRELMQSRDFFDSRFFQFFAEDDICLQIRRGGHLILYEPRAVVHHKGHGGSRRFSRRKIMLFLSDSMQFRFKNVRRRDLIISLCFGVVFGLFGSAVGFFSKSRGPSE
jgi:hypothetical protein